MARADLRMYDEKRRSKARSSPLVPSGRPNRFGCRARMRGVTNATAPSTPGRRTEGRHHMERPRVRTTAAAVVLTAAAVAATVAVAVRGGGPQAATASSHREAPLISQDPTADNTDLYAFVSPDKPSTATIVSNWIPGEDPAAGPNYYTFSQTARYDIYADKNGDGKPDIDLVLPVQEPAEPVLPRQHPAVVHGHEGRERQVERRRPWPADAARQHRASVDSELRRPRGERDPHARRRLDRLRRPA